MGKLSFVFFEESGYVDKLLDYVARYYSKQIVTRKIHMIDKLNEYISKNKNKEGIIFLINEEIVELIDLEDSMLFLVLTDNKALFNEKSNFLFKYLSGEVLIKYIIDYYNKNALKKPIELSQSLRTMCVSFYSSIGGVGVTSVSFFYAKKLSEYYKVLYISFDYASEIHQYTGEVQEGGLSKVFYYYSRNKEKLINKIKEESIFNKVENLYYLNFFESFIDEFDVTLDKFMQGMELIKKHGNFDEIIYDLPSTISQKTNELLKASDKIFLISSLKDEDLLKMAVGLEELKRLSIDEEKIHIMMNKYQSNNKAYVKVQGLDFEKVTLIEKKSNIKEAFLRDKSVLFDKIRLLME